MLITSLTVLFKAENQEYYLLLYNTYYTQFRLTSANPLNYLKTT
jgi:hypothetical protein